MRAASSSRTLRRILHAPLLLTCLAASGTPEPPRATEDPAVTLGRRIYLEGVLPSGQPVQAVVSGDVPFQGTQFSCSSCHQRSGRGSIEGKVGVPAVTGAALFAPRRRGSTWVPAYTSESLAHAIGQGVDPAGRALDPIMPRYTLSDEEMRVLIAYLEQLSSTPVPGVTETTVHFATVVGAGVSPALQQAMLEVLEAFFADTNGHVRSYMRRTTLAPGDSRLLRQPYRKWQMHVWPLDGPESSWSDKLEAYYRDQPVFALLSGIGAGWEPVHRFCERNGLPCILPNTDLPVVEEKDLYTVYFSKGVMLEAEAVAAHLLRQPDSAPAPRILQVFRPDATGTAAAMALRRSVERAGAPAPVDLALAAGQSLTPELLSERVERARADVLALWLPRSDLVGLGELSWKSKPPRIYLSSTLLGGELALVPEGLRAASHVAHPFNLDQDMRANLPREEAWLKARNIPTTHRRVVAQTFFACTLTSEAFMEMRGDCHRDYLLEMIDHHTDFVPRSSVYPRLTFGPGQRFLAKGCYVVEPDDGQGLGPASRSQWLLP